MSLDTPYVMQRVHTLGGRAAHVSEHLELLAEASESNFGFVSLCKVGDARRIISRLLEASRVTPNYSVPVAMRIDARGVLSFEVERPTFGAGLYLRAKRPIGVTVQANPIHDVVQSSVSVAMDAFIESRVAMYGGERALWIDAHGELLSRPWQPVFALFRDTVYTPLEQRSVEYMVATEAIRKAGFHLVVRPIHESVLTRMEELFVVDIMGVSAYAEVGEHKLLSAAAKRIAERAQLF